MSDDKVQIPVGKGRLAYRSYQLAKAKLQTTDALGQRKSSKLQMSDDKGRVAYRRYQLAKAE